MRSRVAVWVVLLASAVPGLLFAPVFGLPALLPPIGVVLGSCLMADELARRVTVLASWRPIVALLAGMLGLAETQLWHTTHGGLPTGATVRGVVAGATESWRLSLQSTWPARPDAELLLFVPLAVLVAAVLGMELLRWPLIALLPSLLLLGLSQAFVALPGTAAVVAGLGYAGVAATLLVVSTSDGPLARTSVLLALLPITGLSVLAAAAVVVTDPVPAPAYSFQDGASVPPPTTRLTNPLDEVAERMRRPDTPVFSYTNHCQVDRWRLVVLHAFDGVSWQADARYRRIGTAMDLAPGVTVPTEERRARILLPGGSLPWLPSQPLPDAVSGSDPLIDQDSGMLLLPGHPGPVRYELSWREPVVSAAALAEAAVDPNATGGFDGLGAVPAGIGELASRAAGDLRPSFQAALVLERYLSRNYQVATGTDLPTGSGWPQLRAFLLDTKRGTSEQFAAAYVAMARLVGIPARLVVGFRAPTEPGPEVLVRNRDVLVWPEVAVAGVGWVPLDPTGAATESAGGGGLADVTAKTRAILPPQPDPQDQRLPPPDKDTAGTASGFHVPVTAILLGLAAVIALAPGGVLLARVGRTVRRRRLTGARAVVAAWWEARDRLRANGIPFSTGMTVRDVTAVAASAVHPSTVDGLRRLENVVNSSLWSGSGASEQDTREAWAAVRLVRAGLAHRPWIHRIRAALNLPSLLPPRPRERR